MLALWQSAFWHDQYGVKECFWSKLQVTMHSHSVRVGSALHARIAEAGVDHCRKHHPTAAVDIASSTHH